MVKEISAMSRKIYIVHSTAVSH